MAGPHAANTNEGAPGLPARHSFWKGNLTAIMLTPLGGRQEDHLNISYDAYEHHDHQGDADNGMWINAMVDKKAVIRMKSTPVKVLRSHAKTQNLGVDPALPHRIQARSLFAQPPSTT